MAFGFHTTADEVLQGIDLTGKFAVVTGGTSGLGQETARALASAGVTVLFSARDDARGTETVSKIRSAIPEATISYTLMKLDNLRSIQLFAEETLQRHDRIDMLINNAGIMATPFSHTEDGFEAQLGTNHLGHFHLTTLLMPALLNATRSRVVNVASSGHHMSDIHWDDPNFETQPYDKWKAYGQSKTANILFAMELDRRMSPEGVNSFSVHPGAITTGLGVHFTPEDRAVIGEIVTAAKIEMKRKSISEGAASTVWAATATELAGNGGAYITDCNISPLGEGGSFEGQAPWAADPDAAKRLWTLSERLIQRVKDTA